MGLRDWDSIITNLEATTTRNSLVIYTRLSILAAWTNSNDGYEQSLEQLVQQVKPTTLQNAHIPCCCLKPYRAQHTVFYSSRYLTTSGFDLTIQPYSTGHSIRGFELDDSGFSPRNTLLSGERIPLPIASFAELVRLLQTPPADINQMDIQRLRHIRTLLPPSGR